MHAHNLATLQQTALTGATHHTADTQASKLQLLRAHYQRTVL